MSVEKHPVDRLLTPAETGDVLGGVATGTLSIWRCTKRYPLKYIIIGGKVRYRLSDVEKFIESRAVEGAWSARERKARAEETTNIARVRRGQASQ